MLKSKYWPALFIPTIGTLYYQIDKKRRDTNFLIDKIKAITDTEIIRANRKISLFTGINLCIHNPTACGTVANAMLDIIPKFSSARNNINYRIERKDSLKDIIKMIKNTDHSFIYQFSISGETLHKIKTWNFILFSFDVHLPNETKNFSGHAFTIYRIGNDEFIFIQSYINIYDHRKMVQTVNRENILDILKKAMYIASNNKINDTTIQYWKSITNVDITDFNNYGTERNSFTYNGNYIKLTCNSYKSLLSNKFFNFA